MQPRSFAPPTTLSYKAFLPQKPYTRVHSFFPYPFRSFIRNRRCPRFHCPSFLCIKVASFDLVKIRSFLNYHHLGLACPRVALVRYLTAQIVIHTSAPLL